MSEKPAQNNETIANSQALTTREQEILDMLLAGSVPREIAEILNTDYEIVLEHQKKLYSKLNVRNINDLLSKYSVGNSAEKNEASVQGIGVSKAVFKKWESFHDTLGSDINLMSSIELIQNNYYETYNISGTMFQGGPYFAGVIAFPDLTTHEVMKKMERFSFTVLGDGKMYIVMLPTIESRLEGEHNNYGKQFTTEYGVISTFSFYINELVQSPLFGKKVPFVQDSIEAFQIQVHSKGNFNLKFWDINFS